MFGERGAGLTSARHRSIASGSEDIVNPERLRGRQELESREGGEGRTQKPLKNIAEVMKRKVKS